MKETVELDSTSKQRGFDTKTCEANWENVQLGIWFSREISFENKAQPSAIGSIFFFNPESQFLSHCYRWVKIGFAYQEKTKKKVFITKCDSSANIKTRNPFIEVFCIESVVIWKVTSTVGIWEDHHWRHLLPVTWSNKWSIRQIVTFFGKQKEIMILPRHTLQKKDMKKIRLIGW